jgi:hypothetical protein
MTQPAPRTYNAAIAVVASDRRNSTIAMPSGVSGVSQALPLSEVTVTINPNEVLIVSNGKGETRHERDLDDALAMSRRLGSEGAPDAVRILVPANDNRGVHTYNLASIHERAVEA